MNNPNCIFCKIIAGEIPSRKVFESINTFAFLDIAPTTSGHTIVVPKYHCNTLLNIPENIIGPFFIDLKKIACILKRKLNFEGFNIIQNNFKEAGQEIPHFHFHIIPRNKDDGKFFFKSDPKMASDDELEKVFQKMK